MEKYYNISGWLVLTLMIFILPLVVYPGEDIYDIFLHDDYSTSTENLISSDNVSQIHNFWEPGDVDWVVFNADPSLWFTIQAEDQASHCDAAIALFHESDLLNPIISLDDWHPQSGNANEEISWYSAATSGTMFVRIAQSPSSPGWFGEETTYTLSITADFGPSTGLATITGICASIGPGGGIIQAGAGGIYTKPRLEILPGALDSFVEFLLEDPGDIGNNPYFDYTKAWLSAHPGNATIVRIYSKYPVGFHIPATLTLQFIDNGPSSGGFKIDDIPDGAQAQDMWIYQWDGAAWLPQSPPQYVDTDTVSMQIMEIDHCVFATAPYIVSKIEGWMLY